LTGILEPRVGKNLRLHHAAPAWRHRSGTGKRG
jgi:hypothetical protein